ncbi:L-aspartate oxidase [Paenibacillus shirakamiensis]|uniref:L-aspartate oxidase n=1 Tax=Paenibacillus shirakamiensis TaxID=1265935 RepID=A0ABS4JQ21_9BACL|nr:L-aspartate oxidase [Paenibacillus shirakamiensis]MBP2002724.1 L-aspartate oxidase [Paenibacillus shirakamiensis]
MFPKYLVDFNIDELLTIHTDVLIIGTGIAGLFTALKASEDRNVILVTKSGLMESNTRYAQGGIAAVFSAEDSPQSHLEDTLIAGAGLCLEKAVEVLVQEGPQGVQELIQMGTSFDQECGQIALTQEGAHSHRRILHANGDATGHEIVRALAQRVSESKNIEVWEHHYVIDLITKDDECLGALIQKPNGERIYLRSEATLICSGGAGQLYRYTTNPEVATADGVALAYRAGAHIRDLEFVQFHPTALNYAGAPRFLISEAVRGEGAILRNAQGDRFMEKYHAQLELAPRDIVARAIVTEMETSKSSHVYLDITHESADLIKHRFPTIYKTCLQYGLDMTTDWIPVAPAAHYMMGGIETNLWGETHVQRLFACGEASSTGVHGANRLASNSLSEAIVFGARIVKKLKELSPLTRSGAGMASQEHRVGFGIQETTERRLRLQKTMVRHVGVRRHDDSLQAGLHELQEHMPYFKMELKQVEEYEFANMLMCALLVTEAAIQRKESRGGHYREDYPDRDDDAWYKHLVFHREKGMLEAGIDDV